MFFQRLALSSVFILFTFLLPAQENLPVEVTPAMQEKILAEIKNDITKQKAKFEQSQTNPVQLNFQLDTAVVEQFIDKWMSLDSRDFGMRDAYYAGAKLYDDLLNKYYKKLLSTLQGDDKKTLVQAQKAWIAFRDAEFALAETISDEKYAGGGTMQPVTEAYTYLQLVRGRTLVIFDHYVRATQNY